MMEQLNRIEIQGLVGNIRVREFEGTKVANISVATNYIYKTKDGKAGFETMWHNVVAWQGKHMPDLSTIEKGMALNVKGRLRERSWTDASGEERMVVELVAQSIDILPDDYMVAEESEE